jgi:hypothetical protein
VIIQVLHQVGIIYPHRGELLIPARLLSLALYCPVDILRADGQFTQRVFGYVLFELAVGNRLHSCRKKVLLKVDKQKKGHQEIPDAEVRLRGQGRAIALKIVD